MTLVQAAIGLGSLAALLVAVYGPWQWICTDYARQVVFEKRDAIFDIAVSGRLSFNSYQYRVIRSSLQASIRFAHELTFPRFLVLLVAISAHGGPQQSRVRRAIDQISDRDTREEVRRLVNEATRAMLVMMVLKSPILAIITVLAAALTLLRGGRSAARDVERRAGVVIEVEAENSPFDGAGAAPALA